MTQNFDRWLGERLKDELPDPTTIPANPSVARYRASRKVRRGLPRFARALVPSVAAQFVLAGAGVAVAVAAGAAATGHPPTSFIPAVGGASSATAPPQVVLSVPGAIDTADHAPGQSSSPKKGSQSAPPVKKAVPGKASTPEPKSDGGAPQELRTPEPKPSASPEPPHGDHVAKPAPSPTPDSEPPHTVP
jgi:hypothetical protein